MLILQAGRAVEQSQFLHICRETSLALELLCLPIFCQRGWTAVLLAGALSLPDIGQIFPDNDPKWKGASSDIFVKEACKLMRDRGYFIGNIDCTIIAQKPKLSPHKEDIRSVCTLFLPHKLFVRRASASVCCDHSANRIFCKRVT